MTDLQLTLVRHGATEWNEGGRWQGVTDNPLGGSGEAQARRLARRLRGQVFDQVEASDLQRAVQTAQLSLPGQNITLDPRLREIHFGAFEGLTVPEMSAHPAFEEWQSDPWQVAPPGGESLAEVAARMRDWAEDLHQPAVIAFSHSVAIRALMCELFGWPLIPQSGYPVPFAHRIGHTSLSRLRRHGGHWTMHTLGDGAHLEVQGEG
ncbi:phosphoglycerate mutase [Deinococcus malanensis]|uniref:Phosphoglycerate mutase n=1 Tax=Deinococcus malanensis TaxID=1706855 RepID=A0ABQ2ETE3_9DEIO|nr:histidine phosphatase family protein [Deinococcus malanensis]GGK25403.1 phosphoglycerate mutase [Deinococcus malanensis]